ncbi:hypothetical protein L804_04637 [Cryptococcus deuterogattii 2001/935-1]|nr:hypothetical protein L804_04637 [Cryptococcus deuterogattii 2001/935-1]
MPQRDSYSWYPPKSALSLSPSYPRPRSGTSDFDNEDRPFQYSTAGPPTVYSELETVWSQPSHMRPRTAGSPAPPLPLPVRSKNDVISPESPLDGIEDDEDDKEDDVDDLYHRSDWEEEPKTSATGWSRSSWAGPTTGGTHLTHFSKLGGIMEDEEEWIPPVPARTPNQLMPQRVSAPPESVRYREVEYAVDQGEVMDSPGEMTPSVYRDRNRNSMSSMIGTRMDNEDEALRNLSMAQSQSTLPSILDLDHLVKKPAASPAVKDQQHIFNSYQNQPHFQSRDPFADSPNDDASQDDQGLTRHRSPYAAQTTPDLTKTYNRGHGPGLGSSPKLLTPEAHQKLGRMSVATARYTLPPQRNPGKVLRLPFHNSRWSKGDHDNSLPPLLSLSAPRHFYLTYRVFILPLLTLTCALILTMCNTTASSALSGFVKIGNGVFQGAQGGGETGTGDGAALGVWGWCVLGVDDPECETYNTGDFKNESGSFTIPGTATLSNLSSLLIALTTLTWLLASFQIVTAFLHFYLFFALSFPLSHLVSFPATRQPREEVDMRVKCERPPYEECLWVWWAWWGHRRAPVGWILGLLVGGLSLATVRTISFCRGRVADRVSLE